MKKFGIGQSVVRREDRPLVTGQGSFTDDLHFDNEVFGVVVRSPFAHADITNLDIGEAGKVAGVLTILTADDLAGKRNILPCLAPIPGKDGKMGAAPKRPVLVKEKVRHIGEAVAFIVAETLEQARDAADLVMVEYDPLDAITDTEQAANDPENLNTDWETGNEAAVDTALGKAAHVVTLKLINNRVVPTAMEPRAVVAEYDAKKGFTLYTPSQGVWGIRNNLADNIFEMKRDKIRVVTGDVGGGFGMKAFTFAEHVLVMAAAEKLKRPVRWTQERTETFFADTQGRDIVSTVKLGLDRGGKILAYRVDSIANLGAYPSEFGPAIPTVIAVPVLGGVYRVPALYVNVKCVLTNTPIVDAYRGAGRPEAAYMLERIMSEAANQLGLGQDEIRRRNMIPVHAMPCKTITGAEYDSGNFEKNLDDAIKNANWNGFGARKEQSTKAGKLRGIGMAYYIECTLGIPTEEVTLEFADDGKVLLYVGTQTNGQGHLTTFSQIIAERLGIDIECIELVEGDSGKKDAGGGTGGSRSLQMIGNAVHVVTKEVIEKGKQLAGKVLEADNIEFQDGLFRAQGTNRSIPVMELAERARALAETLTTKSSYTKAAPTFPNGCHIAEVEIDPDTGVTEVMAYTVVDDFGVVINPLVVAGQVHGGVVQGLGQALTEYTVFEDETGQILTGSFMDYGIPRADNVPEISFSTNEVPCTTNPLGVKGCGEAGTIGACPAIMNAVVDALREKGVRHIDMPATPHRVWQALQVG